MYRQLEQLTARPRAPRLEQQLIILQAANNERFKASETNARLLGYVTEVNSLGSAARFAGAGSCYDDLTSD